MLVIDGQQRLTTVTLLIAALVRALGQTEPIDGFSPRKLCNYYLLNPEEEGERHHKLILSLTDKDSLIAIVTRREQPKEPSLRVTENFALFESWIGGRKGDLTAVCKGLAKLLVVDVALTHGQDNPQLIFERRLIPLAPALPTFGDNGPLEPVFSPATDKMLIAPEATA